MPRMWSEGQIWSNCRASYERMPEDVGKCPNEPCSVSFEHCSVPRHLQQSCYYTEVYCKYASMGCGIKKMRIDMEEHEGSTEHHFPIAMKKITELNILMSRGASISWSTVNTGPQVTFKLSEYTEKKEKSSPYQFEPFFTSPCGYKMMFNPKKRRTSIGTHISVFTVAGHLPQLVSISPLLKITKQLLTLSSCAPPDATYSCDHPLFNIPQVFPTLCKISVYSPGPI